MGVNDRLIGMAQQTEADDVSTELKDAVNSAKGTALAYGSSAPVAKQAADGRWFVKFSTSHTYGRSNAVDAMQDVLPTMELNYSPHGATQWAAEAVEDTPSEDEAEDLVQEGLVYVNQRGYTVEVTGFSAAGFPEVEYPDSQFGDSRTEPKRSRLVEALVKGTVAVLEDPRLVTDGGQEMQNALAAERQMVEQNSEQPSASEQEDEGSQHRHDSVWAAALNLETHEDGRSPRLGVEYRQKNGNGTSRYAGTVERVEVERPEQHFGQDVGQPEVRVVFQRDDGQRMYVTPEGLYTSGSHAPYVGSPVTLTTSTSNTVALPEASGEGEGSSEDDGDDSPTASAPSVDSLEGLAEWVERQGSDLHADVGSTHYSWDIPGFGRQNDPHSGRTAVRNGSECAYVEVRGPRSDRVEQALAALAHQEGLEVSASSHRATLVPPQGW